MQAAAFLTRLPVPVSADSKGRPLADVAWAFPVVGLLVGGLAGLALLLGFQLGLHPLVCGLLAIGLQVMITGALHEDGLADVADGFGGGAKVSDKLRIMRDSSIGSYGALALIFSITLRAGGLAGMATPTTAVLALITAAAVSRAMMVALMSQMDMARVDGLAAGAGKPGHEKMLVALGLAAVSAFLLLGAAGWSVLAFAALAALAVGWLAKRQIGGLTGDVLGTTQQVTDVTALLCVAAVVS
ncbi:MAG: adenosylcobinamide-GDP ribazoletransferase [Rhodospirillaceae bacterium]|nr:adenosylcobinamide-GDP ribazoletransferase [Rhodospirillaceae bacterium]MBL6941848.1 adenosylcobinamide-GDP ribazoletransferase [Rhodospirillales bacterium]